MIYSSTTSGHEILQQKQLKLEGLNSLGNINLPRGSNRSRRTFEDIEKYHNYLLLVAPASIALNFKSIPRLPR